MGCQFLGPLYSAGFKDAGFVICPIPYDATASYGVGARNGPARIIEASQQLELFDEELEIEPYQVGIHTIPPLETPIEPQKAKELCQSKAKELFGQKKTPIFVGGDHSISIGIIEAASHIFDRLTVLQLDAHTDMRDEYQGTRLSHACVARRAMERCDVVQAAIRSSSKEEWEFLKKTNALPITAALIKKDLKNATQNILTRINTKNLYITIDVDCLDPSIMPATGTPEPGGLNWYELTYIVRETIKHHRIVGFDVVELAPIPGLHYPEFTCARLIYKIIGYICEARSKAR